MVVDLGAIEFNSAPLPVELIAFTASSLSSSIQLDWVTASEIDLSGYSVLRSTDGEVFTERSPRRLPWASGDYAYTDRAVLPGQTYYYQLRSEDFDGTTYLLRRSRRHARGRRLPSLTAFPATSIRTQPRGGATSRCCRAKVPAPCTRPSSTRPVVPSSSGPSPPTVSTASTSVTSRTATTCYASAKEIARSRAQSSYSIRKDYRAWSMEHRCSSYDSRGIHAPCSMLHAPKTSSLGPRWRLSVPRRRLLGFPAPQPRGWPRSSLRRRRAG